MLQRVGETVDPQDAVVKIKMHLFRHLLHPSWNIILRCMATGISCIRECWFRRQFRSMSVRIIVCAALY